MLLAGTIRGSVISVYSAPSENIGGHDCDPSQSTSDLSVLIWLNIVASSNALDCQRRDHDRPLSNHFRSVSKVPAW